MIPKSLEPLLSRMKTIPKDDDSLEAELRETLNIRRRIAPTVIMLIENRGIGTGLIRLFKKEDELNQQLLEEFVLRVAMEIKGPTQEKRKATWEKFINEEFEKIDKKFEEIYFELVKIKKMCVLGDTKVCKGAKPSKEMGKVRDVWMKGMPNLKKMYLANINPPTHPDLVDRLINAFNSYLPEINITDMDKQIRKILKPFGYEYKPRSVEGRARRAEKKREWYFLKPNRKK